MKTVLQAPFNSVKMNLHLSLYTNIFWSYPGHLSCRLLCAQLYVGASVQEKTETEGSQTQSPCLTEK